MLGSSGEFYGVKLTLTSHPSPSGTRYVRRTLFDSELLRVGHVVARPAADDCGEIERKESSVVVLPLAGVFAKHDGPRRQVVGTPNHAVFIAAGRPYRVSFPGAIGDECLTLWLSTEAQARALPALLGEDRSPADSLHPHVLLPAAAILARGLLWRRLRDGGFDPLDIEETCVGLLGSALDAARKAPARTRCRMPSQRRLRQVEAVREAIAVHPERRWTLGALSSLAGASPYHLGRVFREEVGATIHRYLTRARLALALKRVLDGERDLAAVAHDTGFSSHSHFTARFRALFGTTPNELRKIVIAPGAIAA
jgi:AraC-like DNA-binding protein